MKDMVIWLIIILFIILVAERVKYSKIKSGQNEVISQVVTKPTVVIPEENTRLSAFNLVEIKIAIDLNSPLDRESIMEQSKMIEKFLSSAANIQEAKIVAITGFGGPIGNQERCEIIGYKGNKKQEHTGDNTR